MFVVIFCSNFSVTESHRIDGHVVNHRMTVYSLTKMVKPKLLFYISRAHRKYSVHTVTNLHGGIFNMFTQLQTYIGEFLICDFF